MLWLWGFPSLQDCTNHTPVQLSLRGKGDSTARLSEEAKIPLQSSLTVHTDLTPGSQDLCEATWVEEPSKELLLTQLPF